MKKLFISLLVLAIFFAATSIVFAGLNSDVEMSVQPKSCNHDHDKYIEKNEQSSDFQIYAATCCENMSLRTSYFSLYAKMYGSHSYTDATGVTINCDYKVYSKYSRTICLNCNAIHDTQFLYDYEVHSNPDCEDY